MPDLDIDKLRRQLHESGVAPRHVVRIVSELSDHLDDLETEAVQHGRSREDAKADAIKRFGNADVISEHVMSRPELKCWLYRFPRVARIVLPVAHLLALPATPIIAGIAHGPTIGRWCASLMIGSLVTAGMMFILQAVIALS